MAWLSVRDLKTFHISDRELQVLTELVKDGALNKEIAARLDIAEGTVKNHMRNAFRKLGVGTRPEAFLMLQDRGLMAPGKEATLGDLTSVKVGDHVIYADESRVEHDALASDVFNPDLINVVYLSGDDSKKDSHGRQIERASSVSRHSASSCFGRTFRHPSTEKPEYRIP